jgi:hypothetical protein
MMPRDHIELIHQEIDGANTPEGSAAFRSLVERDPEARALAAELRRVAQVFEQVAAREPPPHLKRAILDALPSQARASPRAGSEWMTPGAIMRLFVFQLRLATERMEEAIMTKKAMVIGGTVVAIGVVIAGLVTGFPPGRDQAATIGGVERAARYQGRAMTQADVTLQNPEIQALFQNHEILRLVQSDVFRQAMASDAFRQAMASDAFRQAMANDAFRQAMANDAFRQALANDAFRQAMANDAFRQALANDAFRQALANDAFRQAMANDAFRQALANDAFRQVMANDAFRQAMANNAFRSLAQSEVLSQAFMREAMRVQQ